MDRTMLFLPLVVTTAVLNECDSRQRQTCMPMQSITGSKATADKLQDDCYKRAAC